MSENEIWMWLIMGFIPYYINLQQVRREQLLQIYALFWSFEIHARQHQRRWIFRMPLIKRLQNAAWATIVLLRRNEFPPK